MEKKNNRRQDLITLALGVVAVLLLNVFSQYVFTRFDLTSEKRYTLAESTVEMLDSLDDIVYFEVYLEGDFPQGAGDYKRLRDETRIMLDEFNAWSGENVQYEFVDPGANDDEQERKKFQRQLAEKGLIPHPESFMNDDGVQVTQLLFPWAVARYHGREVAIPLLGGSAAAADVTTVNKAVEGLEYELSNGIRKLMMTIKPRIAITQGHGEPDSTQINGFVKGLKEYYDVHYVPFTNQLNTFRDTVQNATQIRNKFDAVIMIAPDSAFTTQELFILDQFIMYGGKALFLVDATSATMDSIQLQGTTWAAPRHYGLENEPGLEDVLYSYGAGLKAELVEDDYCSQVLIPVGQGQQTQFMPAKWHYSPTILPKEKHPIVRNLDPIKFDFVGTIDTITTSAPIKKEVLVRSSDKSSIMRAPNEVLLMLAMYPRPPESFDHPNQNVAVLLEGPFNSYFKQKILPDEIVNSKEIGYQKTGKPTKVIVIADGDVALNPVYQGQPLPLGMDRFNRMNRAFYSNKTFLLNCANYLMDDKGLLSVRSRVVTLRVLNSDKIKSERFKWQLINVVGPVAGILLFGFFRLWSRRRTYGAPVVNTSRMPGMMDYVLSVLAALIVLMIFQSWIAVLLTFLTAWALFWNARAGSAASRIGLLSIAAVDILTAFLFRDAISSTTGTHYALAIVLIVQAVACILVFIRDLRAARGKQTN
jgi:ABC-2 type transport system permease protein